MNDYIAIIRRHELRELRVRVVADSLGSAEAAAKKAVDSLRFDEELGAADYTTRTDEVDHVGAPGRRDINVFGELEYDVELPAKAVGK